MNQEYIDTLKAERLYYTLRYDLDLGRQLFFELARPSNSLRLPKLLSGEMRLYVDQYKPSERFEIYKELAVIQKRLQHSNQERWYWEKALILAKELRQDVMQVEALIGLYNVVVLTNPDKALQEFLVPALKICEETLSMELPRVQYEMGYAYRLKSDIDMAIMWYERARDSALKYKADLPRLATILNDLGFAYTYRGDYERSEVYVNQALRLRQKHLEEVEEQIRTIYNLISSPNKANIVGLRSQLASSKLQESGARLRVGMAYNTIGEVSRYQGELEKAIYYYSKALEIFESEANYRWQAKSLAARGEAHRRMALEKRKWVDPKASDEHIKLAKLDIELSLRLCNQHLINPEQDTANRRMGRLLHDQALSYQKEGSYSQAQKFLEEAQKYFERGLKYAIETEDVLEELENLTEIAFLVDDFTRVTELLTDEQTKRYETLIERFSVALEGHRQDKERIYQFTVFENLLNLEKGAYAFVRKDYSEALNYYLDGYVGLASDPGYGSARYKTHFAHLIDQIEKLDDQLAKEWCESFIDAWKKHTIIDSSHSQTLAQYHSDLVDWCILYLLTKSV